MTAALLFCACLLVSFLYAGLEAGLLSVDRVRLRSRVAQNDAAALRVNHLLDRPERLMATVLLVTNFADVVALLLITNVFAQWFGGRGIIAAGALMLPVYLIGVQLLPKSIFRRFPYRALAAFAGLLEFTLKIFGPVLSLGGWWFRHYSAGAEAGAENGGATSARPSLFSARDEFRSLAAEGMRTGALSPVEHRMIDNVMTFSAQRAADLMTPPPQTLAARDGLRVADLLDFARANRLDFLPVVQPDTGALIALVDVFTVLFDPNPQRDAAVAYLRRPLVTVAPGDAAPRVLQRLRSARLNAAAVLDDQAQLTGVIRTKALLERLVRDAAQ